MGKKARQKRERREQPILEAPTNLNDVVIKVIDSFFGLANSGKILGLLILGFLFYIFYLSFKLPPEYLDKYIMGLASFLSSEKYYILPLGLLSIFSISVNIYVVPIYKREIRRVANERGKVMHGLETGEMNPLEKHISSKFDIQQEELDSG